jgi:hypothetical protein
MLTITGVVNPPGYNEQAATKRVRVSESAGVVPRAISDIFRYHA